MKGGKGAVAAAAREVGLSNTSVTGVSHHNGRFASYPSNVLSYGYNIAVRYSGELSRRGVYHYG